MNSRPPAARATRLGGEASSSRLRRPHNTSRVPKKIDEDEEMEAGVSYAIPTDLGPEGTTDWSPRSMGIQGRLRRQAGLHAEDLLDEVTESREAVHLVPPKQNISSWTPTKMLGKVVSSAWRPAAASRRCTQSSAKVLQPRDEPQKSLHVGKQVTLREGPPSIGNFDDYQVPSGTYRDATDAHALDGDESGRLTVGRIQQAAKVLVDAANESDLVLRTIFQGLSASVIFKISDIVAEIKDEFAEDGDDVGGANSGFMGMCSTMLRKNVKLIQNIQDLFHKKGTLDKKGDLQLTPESLSAIFEELQMPLLKCEADRIFSRVDANSDGKLSWKEFADAAQNDEFLEMLAEEAQMMREWKVPKDYDFTRATCQVHCQKDFIKADRFEGYNEKKHGPLFGDFKEIRCHVDYSWHSNYTEERQAWQDSVVRRVSICGQPQSQPWAIFTAGAMGTGKGFTMSWLSEKGYLELENVVHIDPDHFKSMMPEWRGYVGKDPHQAGTNCHLESGFLQELTQEVAMEQSQNCWIDGSLHDHQWYTQVFAKIRARYPHYRLAIIYIYAAPELVFERAEKRGQKTGRYVPKEILAKSIKNTQIAAEILGPQVDFYAEISNDAEEPLLMKCEDRGHSFRAFSQRFRLFENAIRAFPANMPPVAFMDEKGATELFNVTQAIKDAFQTRVFSSLTNAKDAPPQGCLALPIKEFFTPAILEQIKPLLRGKKGAEHIMALPVTRSPEEVKHLLRWDGAPDTASHMLYCIGAFTKDGKPVQQAAISQCSKFVQSLLSNQTIGFSIYVGDQMQIVGLSRMSISQGSGRSGNRRFVAYSAAREVDPRFREALEAQGRWNVGLFPLMKFHAKHCALVLPNEIKDCPAGALAFVLHNSKCIYFARIPPD